METIVFRDKGYTNEPYRKAHVIDNKGNALQLQEHVSYWILKSQIEIKN